MFIDPFMQKSQKDFYVSEEYRKIIAKTDIFIKIGG